MQNYREQNETEEMEEIVNFKKEKTLSEKATLLFADIFSALPIAFYFSNLKDAFSLNKFKLYLILSICMLVSDFAAYRLKRLNYPDWFYKISRRPRIIIQMYYPEMVNLKKTHLDSHLDILH